MFVYLWNRLTLSMGMKITLQNDMLIKIFKNANPYVSSCYEKRTFTEFMMYRE